MVHEALSTLLAWMAVFQPALTRPGFDNMLVVFTGSVLTAGPHAVTQALVTTEVAGRRHHEAFHRFFSRGTWDPDAMGRLLFDPAVAMFVRAGSPIRVAVDDTLAPKKGPHVFGIRSHLDAVRSTRRFRVFAFGHCWVVLALLLPLPFCDRTWALPLLFRLYRNKKECVKKEEPYRKKTELAREMLDSFEYYFAWIGEVTDLYSNQVAAIGSTLNDLALVQSFDLLRQTLAGLLDELRSRVQFLQARAADIRISGKLDDVAKALLELDRNRIADAILAAIQKQISLSEPAEADLVADLTKIEAEHPELPVASEADLRRIGEQVEQKASARHVDLVAWLSSGGARVVRDLTIGVGSNALFAWLQHVLMTR